MDLVVQTSLEALLLKATQNQNQSLDNAAIQAFCTLVNKEKDGAHIGVKVIATQLPNGSETEMLQILQLLDVCMGRCGPAFQSEVGKFRFLNEMIKLVSPKYLGGHTPSSVKQKVLQLLYLWTLDYPKETKIKEAYEMLQKQGVVREIPNPCIETDVARRRTNYSIFQDEEKSRILQKLLQSKDPEDIQAANWLIKSMVKEDDKRAELKSKYVSELESVQNNVRLLNEMLDSYKPGQASTDELDLIKELHQSCERLKPNLIKLTTETRQNEDVMDNVLHISDELNQVFIKYNHIILKENFKTSPSLLDFDNNIEGASNTVNETAKTDIDALNDIFSASNIDTVDVLQPTTVLDCDKAGEDEKNNRKSTALEELDVLSEHLLKENLNPSKDITFKKTQEKIPMNLLCKAEVKEQIQKTNEITNLNLDCLLNEKTKPTIEHQNDDFLVDLNDDKMLEGDDIEKTKINPKEITNNTNLDIDLKDIYVNLSKIKPSTTPPISVLDKNGLNVSLHLAKDKPKKNVYVFVITTQNKNEQSISNFVFQAVVPKGCKIKLQPPSSNDLPAYNPFTPPSTITQIMLIGKPESVQISLKYIISYVIEEEICTEMGEVENLPL